MSFYRDYNAGLTETQKLEVLDLVSLIFQRHRGGDMTPLTGISPAAEATRAEVIRELKVPLLLDDERFSDVLVNPTMIREAEIKCKSAKVPERYLLNKVLELVFTAEEFTAARGTKSLNKHKQEAVKEYMNATCQALNIGNTEEIYTTILQNKIGNYRYKSKPVQTKAKKKTNQPGTSSEEQEVTIPSWMKVALEGSQDFE